MSVSFNENYKLFRLDTDDTTYAFAVTNLGFIEHLYYGRKVGNECDFNYLSNRQIYTFATNFEGQGREFTESTFMGEISSGNSADFRDGGLWIENGDGTVGNRFTYKSHEIYEGRTPIDGLPYSRETEGTQTLLLHLTDEEKEVGVDIYYVVFPKSNVIARHVEIINHGAKPLKVLKAYSLQVDLPRGDLDIIEVTGIYLYEFGKIQRSPLKKGVQGFKSVVGSTSHHCNALTILCAHNADEDAGDSYGFNLLYSGSFSTQIEVDRLENTRVFNGILPDGLCYEVKAGEKFVTPEGVYTFSHEGIGQVSRNFHDHTRASIIPEKFATSPRPIVVNTWEGSHMEVTEENVLALADCAADVGADTVVLDDGWFRGDTFSGLGDFFVDPAKFPSGMKSLAEKIRAKGLKFGIWFEPESVVEGSDYYKNDPDCALKTRTDYQRCRDQLVLDFTDDKHVEGIFKRMIPVLDDVQADYLKWDYNRYIHEAGSKNCPFGELYYRQTRGVYKLLQMIRDRYPNMLIEGCAGGGGRFDLGILFYCPQIWTSDNTDPFARTYIQYGATYGYPTSAISCHFTRGVCTSRIPSTPRFRYLVACMGPYGYELDVTVLSKEERAELKDFSDKYRKISQFALDCDLYRLTDVNEGLYSVTLQVSKDKSKALFNFLQLHSKGFYENVLIRLKGLDPDAYYRDENSGEIFSGAALMYAGRRIPNLFYVGSGGGLQIVYAKVENPIK